MKKNITVILIVSALLLAVVFAPSAANGVSLGLDLCLKTLIPALYVFAVISNLAVDYIPKTKLSLLVLGTLGGYVSAATMLANSGLSRKAIERYLPFCITPSLVFVLALFGHNPVPSIIVIVSLLFPNLLIMIFTKSEKISLTTINPRGLVSATKTASVGMLSMCSAVILFCAFAEILSALGVPLSARGLNFEPLLDISRLMLSRASLSPTYAAVFLSLGGISTWLQIKVILKSASIKRYLITRIPAAMLSGTLAYLLSQLFYHPTEAVAAVSIGNIPVAVTLGGGNVYGGVVLIIACILLLISGKRYDIIR
jgi:hypothetical protein